MDANIGAGTIFCNYDGKAKHRTEIGKGAFIGSNSALVAPVKVGANAYVGSGSVITDNVPAGALALGRGRQVNKTDWAPGKAASASLRQKNRPRPRRQRKRRKPNVNACVNDCLTQGVKLCDFLATLAASKPHLGIVRRQIRGRIRRMCGIVGIFGREPVAEEMVEALKRLEYRGYDSAGVATLEGGHLTRRRAEGKLKNLENG